MSSGLLEIDENEIYKLIKEYLRKKSYFMIEEIVDFISYRVAPNPNINRNAIILVLKELIRNKEIIPGIRLLKENVLENENRENIFDFIKKNPGVNINEIKKKLNFGTNHALWHLHCLERFEFIRSVKFGNQRAFFNSDLDIVNDKIIFYFRKEKVKQILFLLEKAGSPLRPTAIASKLKTNYNTTKKYIDILTELKVLSKVNGDEKKSYILNQEYYEKVLKEFGNFIIA